MPFDTITAYLISAQHKLFYIIMAFARFNLYAHSYTFLWEKAFGKRRARGGRWAWWLEVVGLSFFLTWFGAVLYGCGSWGMAIAYLLVSHIVTSPLHVQVPFSLCKFSSSR
jgi:sphingolipid 8-(E)-desaturase